MTKDEMKLQLQTAVGEWVERVCVDDNVTVRHGPAQIRFSVIHEGEEDGQVHFEGSIEEVRHIEISDMTNPMQDADGK